MTRRSKAQWRTLFAEHDASGLSAAVFCRERSLCPKYFSIRKRQLGWPKTTSSSFVAVKPVAESAAPSVPQNSPSDIALRIVDVRLSADQLSQVLQRILR